MVNLMFAYFNVILIGDKNISDGNSIHVIAIGAERDYSLIHFTVLTSIITSALASTLNVDFPVQNSFNLFVDS